MLYRAFDCYAHGWDRDPAAVAWIRGIGRADAEARLKAALAATWGVEPDRVEWGNFDSEWDIEHNGDGKAAGDRHLVVCGWWGGRPMYDDGENLLLFLCDRDRRRIGAAYAAARQHEQEIAAAIEAKKDATQNEKREAVKLRARAAHAGTTAGRGPDAHLRPGWELVYPATRRHLLCVAGLLELARQQRADGDQAAANDNEHDARRRLAAVIAGDRP